MKLLAMLEGKTDKFEGLWSWKSLLKNLKKLKTGGNEWPFVKRLDQHIQSLNFNVSHLMTFMVSRLDTL